MDAQHRRRIREAERLSALLRGTERGDVEIGEYLRRGPRFDDLEIVRPRDLTRAVELDRRG